ncbi:hypothetical protein BD289DRAFT_54814 [Coniella lustricola]|uniref:DUF4038 domain-containing protein n=1 Tax=Coniella lustricola TaxID=2025994 RepID=A0A2T3A0X0_9PEZI|nr:hypothetical protein BD289DRAFT_54814 [Coniella lustricola]
MRSSIISSSLWLACWATGSTAAWRVPSEYAVQPSADGRFLQDASGDAFFWQADTAWLLFHRLNQSEADFYLSDRASKGFTVILAVGFTQIGITSPNRNGDLPFINEDVTQPNEAYWAYIDSITELAWSKSLRICMVPAWGSYVHGSDNTPSVLNTSTASVFGQFIGQRYPYLPKTLIADTNPWWENKTAVKDDYAQGGVAPDYPVVDWSPVYNELANGIVAGERQAIANSSTDGLARVTRRDNATWNPLMSIHPTNQWFSGGPLAFASAFFGSATWLTLDTCQSGHADFPPNPPIPWWNARRGWEPIELMYAASSMPNSSIRPVLDNEAHYENRYDNGNALYPVWNASDVRIGSWQAVFSGAAGLTYGADAVMQMADPVLYPADGSGPGTSWLAELKLPGSGQMQWIQRAVRDRGTGAFFTRVPAQEIILSSAGENDQRVTATADEGGSWIMVYTPTGLPFEITTSSLVSCNVKASWLDPTIGNYTSFSYEQCGDNTAYTFTPPLSSQHTDWTLVLEAVE